MKNNADYKKRSPLIQSLGNNIVNIALDEHILKYLLWTHIHNRDRDRGKGRER